MRPSDAESGGPDPGDARAGDRCPGLISTHPAADGHVARIRLVGGELTAAQLHTLATMAAEFGDGFLEITGRANLQIRGLPASVPLDDLEATGVVRSVAHDRVRNIMVSPRSGRLDSPVDVRAIARAVDDGVVASDELANLPGRFLFGFDDGHGDVLAHGPDVGVVALPVGPSGTDEVEIVVGGRRTGRAVPARDAVVVVLDLAEDFRRRRTDEWRVTELPEATLNALIQMLGAASTPVADHLRDEGLDPDPLVGWFTQDDGRVLLGAVCPLGRIPARTAEFFAAVDAPIVLTPDREILLCDLEEGVADTVVRVLAPMGVIFDATSPWVRVSACAGSPGCAHSLADVRADLAEHVASGAASPDRREHWVGCERGCGTPHRQHRRVEARPTGYDAQRITPTGRRLS